MVRNLVSTTHPLISLDAVQVRLLCISIYRIYSSFFINRSLKSFCVTFYSIFMVLSCCSASRRGATVETHTLSPSPFLPKCAVFTHGNMAKDVQGTEQKQHHIFCPVYLHPKLKRNVFYGNPIVAVSPTEPNRPSSQRSSDYN